MLGTLFRCQLSTVKAPIVKNNEDSAHPQSFDPQSALETVESKIPSQANAGTILKTTVANPNDAGIFHSRTFPIAVSDTKKKNTIPVPLFWLSADGQPLDHDPDVTSCTYLR